MNDLSTGRDERQKTDTCPECLGSGVIEIREPFVFGTLVHKLEPCRECAGRGRMPGMVKTEEG